MHTRKHRLCMYQLTRKGALFALLECAEHRKLDWESPVKREARVHLSKNPLPFIADRAGG